MKFRNIKAKDLIINLLIAFLWPIVSALRSKHHILAFSDACTFTGLAFLIIGLVNIFILSGDFDITGYVAQRALSKDKKEFSDYMEQQENKRKESFNYPLFSGIILLFSAWISSLFA